MHGRLKVRTSDEEKERKKKEQALKVMAYQAAIQKISQKRSKDECDDEMVVLTTKILQRNPDVTTLWNIRRECIERKAKTITAAAEDAATALQALYDIELSFTEQCLMVNPKSYNCWHHRCWSLEHSPNANWEWEVELCNKYLKMDERNFHTWNYRRYVVGKAGVAKESELDYCTEKIKVNFSNYSSWHYRSLLLPVLYPYIGDANPKRPMAEHKLKEELEMVLTAAFTDPNDSSAWFYQRWLLGSSRQELGVCAFRCDRDKAVMAFTRALPIDPNAEVCLINKNDERIVELTKWRGTSDTEQQAEITWVAKMTSNEMDFNAAYRLQVSIADLPKQVLPLKSYDNGLYFMQPPNMAYAYTEDVRKELESQLQSCDELLEFEPDSKWTLLTSSLLMRALDSHKYHEKSLQYLGKLQKFDSLREGYYKDLASKWVLEKLLIDWSRNEEEIPKVFNLKGASQLFSICFKQYISIADSVLLSDTLQEVYKNGNSLKTFQNIKVPN